MALLGDLVTALAAGDVRVVDLTQPLSEGTPVLQLPEPFANTPGLSRRPLSRYDDAGPAWAWDVLELGEHVGTHFDAPIHWITGRAGEDVASVPPTACATVRRCIGATLPACFAASRATDRKDPTCRPPPPPCSTPSRTAPSASSTSRSRSARARR